MIDFLNELAGLFVVAFLTPTPYLFRTLNVKESLIIIISIIYGVAVCCIAYIALSPICFVNSLLGACIRGCIYGAASYAISFIYRR